MAEIKKECETARLEGAVRKLNAVSLSPLSPPSAQLPSPCTTVPIPAPTTQKPNKYYPQKVMNTYDKFQFDDMLRTVFNYGALVPAKLTEDGSLPLSSLFSYPSPSLPPKCLAYVSSRSKNATIIVQCFEANFVLSRVKSRRLSYKVRE
jgi:hypothetical protein